MTVGPGRRASLADERPDLTQRHGQLREVGDPFHRELPHEAMQPFVGIGPLLEERLDRLVDR